MPRLTISKFQKLILEHYQKHGRKNLPWKKTRDPYKILVSEIMLQQTQVSRVLPKYRQFLREFPTVKALAQAPDSKLLKVWQGLGYWRRAKYLKAAARMVIDNPALSKLFGVTSERRQTNFGDLALSLKRVAAAGAPRRPHGRYSDARPVGVKLPTGPAAAELQELPGVGPYTAGAVACFAFGSSEPFIDTNIRRVYLHFFFADKAGVSDKQILKIARRALYKKDLRTWHYALFDYGATVLKDRRINRRSKHYAKQSQFTGSFRSFRAHVMEELLKNSPHRLPKKVVENSLNAFLKASNSLFQTKDILRSLQKDSLIKQNKTHYSL